MKLKKHYQNVAEMGCCVTGYPNVVLHHVVGGSMVPMYGLKSMSGRGISDWLVIPLMPALHTSGPRAIHSIGAGLWEEYYGTQMDHLRKINAVLDYDIFELAKKDSKIFKRSTIN